MEYVTMTTECTNKDLDVLLKIAEKKILQQDLVKYYDHYKKMYLKCQKILEKHKNAEIKILEKIVTAGNLKKASTKLKEQSNIHKLGDPTGIFMKKGEPIQTAQGNLFLPHSPTKVKELRKDRARAAVEMRSLYEDIEKLTDKEHSIGNLKDKEESIRIPLGGKGRKKKNSSKRRRKTKRRTRRRRKSSPKRRRRKNSSSKRRRTRKRKKRRS
jgi:hypothetical protein